MAETGLEQAETSKPTWTQSYSPEEPSQKHLQEARLVFQQRLLGLSLPVKYLEGGVFGSHPQFVYLLFIYLLFVHFRDQVLLSSLSINVWGSETI